MTNRDLVNTLYDVFAHINGIEESLERARFMEHDPLSKWEAQGYVIECRLATRYRSELIGAIGQVQRRQQAGEDVKLLLHESQKHVIVMRRDGD